MRPTSGPSSHLFSSPSEWLQHLASIPHPEARVAAFEQMLSRLSADTPVQFYLDLVEVGEKIKPNLPDSCRSKLAESYGDLASRAINVRAYAAASRIAELGEVIVAPLAGADADSATHAKLLGFRYRRAKAAAGMGQWSEAEGIIDGLINQAGNLPRESLDEVLGDWENFIQHQISGAPIEFVRSAIALRGRHHDEALLTVPSGMDAQAIFDREIEAVRSLPPLKAVNQIARRAAQYWLADDGSEIALLMAQNVWDQSTPIAVTLPRIQTCHILIAEALGRNLHQMASEIRTLCVASPLLWEPFTQTATSLLREADFALRRSAFATAQRILVGAIYITDVIPTCPLDLRFSLFQGASIAFGSTGSFDQAVEFSRRGVDIARSLTRAHRGIAADQLAGELYRQAQATGSNEAFNEIDRASAFAVEALCADQQYGNFVLRALQRRLNIAQIRLDLRTEREVLDQFTKLGFVLP